MILNLYDLHYMIYPKKVYQRFLNVPFSFGRYGLFSKYVALQIWCFVIMFPITMAIYWNIYVYLIIFFLSLSLYICIYICVCLHIHTYTYIYIYIHIHMLCIYICMYVCIYVCMYRCHTMICIYIHKYIVPMFMLCVYIYIHDLHHISHNQTTLNCCCCWNPHVNPSLDDTTKQLPNISTRPGHADERSETITAA